MPARNNPGRATSEDHALDPSSQPTWFDRFILPYLSESTLWLAKHARFITVTDLAPFAAEADKVVTI